MRADHGTLHFEIENNILIVEGCGPWNKEAMILSLKNASLVQRLRTHEKWGVIVIVKGDPIHTPEAAELLIEYVKYDKKSGRIATALILTDSTSPMLGERHIGELYNQAGEKYQFFNNIVDAKMWVTSLLVQAQ